MTYDPAKHHRTFDCEPPVRAQGRRSIRLKGYDYTSPGAYSVTICVRERKCALGDERELDAIHRYIVDNPLEWKLDRDNL